MSISINLEELKKVGGHRAVVKKRRHPSMIEYLENAPKNVVSTFDLSKASEETNKALDFINKLGTEKKTILFITDRKEAADEMQSVAERLRMPFVSARWIGGTISNFTHTKKRIAHFKKMEEEKATGKWENLFTKKEVVLLNREFDSLNSMFSGVRDMESLPSAVFIIDTARCAYAVREAKGAKIPVIGYMNANNNLDDADYKIIANNNTLTSIKYIMEQVLAAYTAKKI